MPVAGIRTCRLGLAGRIWSVTALAVIASGATAVSAEAAPPLRERGSLVATPTAPVESGPLEAVAMPELSTETSTTRMLPSGELELDVATAPVNFLDEDGQWAPIDTELVEPTEDSDSPEVPAEEYAAENAAASYTASIPQDAAVTPVRMALDDVAGIPAGEVWASLKMDGLTGAPVIEDDTATFTGVENADEVQLQATGEGLKELIVLDSAPASSTVEYRYELTASEGITPRLTGDGSIDFIRDSAPGQEPVLTIPIGNMYDSAETVPVEGGDPDGTGGATTEGPAYTNDVGYDLRRAQGVGLAYGAGISATAWGYNWDL